MSGPDYLAVIVIVLLLPLACALLDTARYA